MSTEINPDTYFMSISGQVMKSNGPGAQLSWEDPEKYDIEKIKQTGFLAQEVESAAKESDYDFSGVKAPVNENKPYSISYAEFVVPLVKAVQEQQLVIEELKKEIEELKSLSQNN